MFAISGAESHGWTSTRTLVALAIAAALLTGFRLRRASHDAAAGSPPHVEDQVARLQHGGDARGHRAAGRTVFLGSIFFQTVLGYSAPQAGLGFLPLAIALVLGTHVASHISAHVPARVVAVRRPRRRGRQGPRWSPRRRAPRPTRLNLMPGLIVVGLGAGMVFVSVSASAMAGIPAQHSGMASGFLMTGHEVGAALGVAVISAVATSAGVLTTARWGSRSVQPRLHGRGRHRRGLRRVRAPPDARHPRRRRRTHAHALSTILHTTHETHPLPRASTRRSP